MAGRYKKEVREISWKKDFSIDPYIIVSNTHHYWFYVNLLITLILFQKFIFLKNQLLFFKFNTEKANKLNFGLGQIRKCKKTFC